MATGAAVMVTEEVATTAAHPPEVTVLVTIYVPTELVASVITPVEELRLNPAGDDVKTPAIPAPLYVGAGFVPL